MVTPERIIHAAQLLECSGFIDVGLILQDYVLALQDVAVQREIRYVGGSRRLTLKIENPDYDECANCEHLTQALARRRTAAIE